MKAAIPEHLPLWTGRLAFDLSSGGGLPVATVEVSVRIDMAIFWISSRTIAVIDRDRLRRWVHHPHQPLQAGDAELRLLGSQLAICVDASAPYPLPAETVHQLVTLV